MFIIDDLLIFIAEKIQGMAEEELEDNPEKLKRELLDLQMRLEMEEFTEEEYKKKEDEILVRMEALREEEGKKEEKK